MPAGRWSTPWQRSTPSISRRPASPISAGTRGTSSASSSGGTASGTRAARVTSRRSTAPTSGCSSASPSRGRPRSSTATTASTTAWWPATATWWPCSTGRSARWATRSPTSAVPVHLQQAEVGERVAQRADLPVEHGHHVAVAGHHAVVEAVVAVDDRGRPLLGDALEQPLVGAVDRREVTRAALVPLAVPPLELALDVPLVPAEIGEAGPLEIDGVDRCHGVDQRPAGIAASRLVENRDGALAVAQDVAVDVTHHVERCTVDGRVVAEPPHGRYGNGCVLQARQNPVLAAHVVCARQHVTQRRATQDVRVVALTIDAIGEVGVAAGDDLERERSTCAVDVRLEPTCDGVAVDSGYVAHLLPRVAIRAVAHASGSVSGMAAIDVTDETFQTEVLDTSTEVPVVVDLWAPWCGPCKTLGPIIEKVVDATGGKVVLAKVNVDENPGLSQAFKVQSIPAVYAVKDGAVVDGFMGAYPEQAVQEFVNSLLPSQEEKAIAELLAAGDEASLRIALSMEPANEDVIVALAELLVRDGDTDEALALLSRIPESDRTRPVAALARVGAAPQDDYDEQLTALLDQVKTDDEARQKFVDLLELMGPEDPRTVDYRRQLTARLY